MTLQRSLKTVASTLFALILLSPTIRAEVTYRLVTNDDQLIDQCVYLFVAADLDIAAASKIKNDPFGFMTVPIVRDGDQLIIPDGSNVGEFRISYQGFRKCLCGSPALHADYPWAFREAETGGKFLTYYSNVANPENSGIKYDEAKSETDDKNRTAHYLTTLSIDPTDYTCKTSYFTFNAFRGSLFFANKNSSTIIFNAYDPGPDKGHKVQLYRKDVYDLHVMEMKKTDNGYDLKIHINQYDSNNEYSKGNLMYLFSDKKYLPNDSVYKNPETIIKKNYNDGDLEINYSGNKKYLWLIRDHGTLYYQTDAIRVELKDLPTLVTSADEGHYTEPEQENLSVGQAIDFEPKHEDVKIYYTLDGQDPVIPGQALTSSEAEIRNASIRTVMENEDHTGKTYDLDERPLIYDGSSISVRYVAVKAGYAPGPIRALELSGSTTSITSVITDTNFGETKYFNLHGFRVDAPLQPGIYIRATESKIEKIVIR